MGKLKRSSVIKKGLKKNGKNKKVQLSIEELLDEADQYIDQCELEKAYQYVKQALDIDPKHVQALETMASVQMEMGNTESAKTIYKKLIEINPDNGYSKYMCLAQLSSDLEAVNYYKKGIDLILKEYNQQLNQPNTSAKANDENEEENGISKSDISTAYGSVAEIYLTDLCMEEDADKLCKLYLDKSLEYDSENPETLQLLASYWLSKDDLEQAKKSILESLDIWLPKYIEAEESGPLVDPTQAITLTYDSRISTSRILTEVEEFDKAVTVLEQLVEEDDEVVVVWYMLGWVNYCKGEDYYSNAKFYLKKAEELSVKIKYEQKYLDDELKVHIKELLEKLIDVPSDDEDMEEKENLNDENEDDYETLSEDEENNNEHADEKKNGKSCNGNHLRNKIEKKESKLSSENVNFKKLNDSKTKGKHLEEPMEFT